ncbi:E3 ubiquitin-protein ligase ATL4-like [Argentina anserina]|uniref:E3 ubiquitin-protein ligase ATL4-like n=1 Tax=Argentina anserina TaxID=57926 RepID=UPI0021768B7F|nr:E3 ubiquitin-protein ligase ATL4-like [Potentilla anserina]
MSLEAIVLLILFILVAALLLYYYIRRLHPLPHSAAAPLHSSSSRRRQVSPAPPSSSAGLPLPRFKFSDLTRPGSVTVTGDCAICLSEFEPDDDLRLLPLCLHAFHVECIDTWLAGESRICPICRAEIFRSDSDLFRATASGGSFRLEIGNVSRGRRPDTAAFSSSRVHSLSGGELEYIVDQEWELLMLPVPDGGEEGENVAVVIDGQAPSADTSEYQGGHGMVFTGSSRRWTDLSAVFEALSRWLS